MDVVFNQSITPPAGVNDLFSTTNCGYPNFLKGFAEGKALAEAHSKAEGELAGSIAISEQAYKKLRERGISREDSIAIAAFSEITM